MFEFIAGGLFVVFGAMAVVGKKCGCKKNKKKRKAKKKKEKKEYVWV